MPRRKQWIIIGVSLSAIIALAAFLRFYQLTFQSFWNDELSTWYRSNFASLRDVIEIGSRPDPHPPGYYILIYFVQRWFGNSEVTLRLPSVIAGILTIPAIYALGKKLYSWEVGLYAAALMAVLWCPVFYGQEARANSLLVLSSVLAELLWIIIMQRLARGDRSKSLWLLGLAYVLNAAFAAYLHHMGLFLIALQGAYALLVFVRRRGALLGVVLLYGAFTLLYLPWLPEMFRDMLEYQTWIQTPGLIDLVRYGQFIFNFSTPILALAVLGYLWVAWRDGRTLIKSPRQQWHAYLLNPTLLLFAWLLGPVLIAFGKSLVSTPVFIYRNLIICIPAAYLLLARALSLLPIRRRWRALAGSALTVALLLHLIVGMQYYRRPVKEQFREATQYIVAHDAAAHNAAAPDARVMGYAWTGDYFNYYFRQLGSTRTVDVVLGDETEIAQLEAYLAQEQPKSLWYIAAHKKPDAAFLAVLGSKMTLVEQKEFVGAHVWLWRAP